MGLIITFCLGVFILVGILFIKLINNKKIIEQLSISIALGTMLSLVILDLIPEAFDTFKTDNNVFSKRGLDFGTRTLLENINTQSKVIESF